MEVESKGRINKAHRSSTRRQSREEIIRELAFHAMVQGGLVDSDAGRVISNEEMACRIRTWQK